MSELIKVLAKLRGETGLPIFECKKALELNGNDYEKTLQYLLYGYKKSVGYGKIDNLEGVSGMLALEEEVGLLLKQYNLHIVTAESLTAGLIGATLANVPGSSAYLDCGFIVYTEEMKMKLLGVNEETLRTYTVVSEQVASEMAFGALSRTKANLAIAVTGYAGPAGGTEEDPVGTVCFGFAIIDKFGLSCRTEKHHFNGGRNEVRKATVDFALTIVLDYLKTIKSE